MDGWMDAKKDLNFSNAKLRGHDYAVGSHLLLLLGEHFCVEVPAAANESSSHILDGSKAAKLGIVRL
jgi:hypothetical protein